jgi:MFS family permease
MQRIALPWLVYRLSGSPFLLGVVGFAGQIPASLLAPFAGVLIDRWNRHHILVATQILAMIQALALAFLFFIGALEVWHIILLGIFLGVINAFDMPARQSFVVEMVENREDLGNAIALNSSMVNGARLLGPSIAGALIAATGEGICFLLNGLSYLFVIVSLLMMKVTPRKVKNRDTQVLQGLKEGFSYAFGFAPVRAIILLLGLVSLMGMPYTVLIPVFVKEILHGGSHTFGFLMGASGVGALIGAFYLASRKSVLGLGKIIPLSAAVFGLGLIAFSLSRLFLLSLVLMLITGFGMIMQMASSNTILQTIVDDDKRGRVMSFYMSFRRYHLRKQTSRLEKNGSSDICQTGYHFGSGFRNSDSNGINRSTRKIENAASSNCAFTARRGCWFKSSHTDSPMLSIRNCPLLRQAEKSLRRSSYLLREIR